MKSNDEKMEKEISEVASFLAACVYLSPVLAWAGWAWWIYLKPTSVAIPTVVTISVIWLILVEVVGKSIERKLR